MLEVRVPNMVMVRDGETLQWEVIISLGTPPLEGTDAGLVGPWVALWEWVVINLLAWTLASAFLN